MPVVRQNKDIILIGILFFVFWLLFLGTILSYTKTYSVKNLSELGSVGDAFGIFNAIVSALGFSGILATIYIQNKSIAEQKLDQHKQVFDSSFFEIMNLLRDIRRDVKYRTFKGNDAFSRAASVLSDYTDDLLSKSPDGFGTYELSTIYITYIHDESEFTLGPYYRLVYSILNRTLNDEKLSASDKIYYGNLVRSQLSTPELWLIGFNAMTPYSNDFGQKIVEFRLLKYLPKDHLTYVLQTVYDPITFYGREALIE